MHILYVSSLCSKDRFRDLFENASIKPAQQAQKYHRLIVEGLARNEGTSIEVISSLPVNRLISTKLYHRGQTENSSGVIYRYLSFVNLPILRQTFLFFNTWFCALNWLIKNQDRVAICDVLNIAISSAALLATKIARRSSVGIITDVPAFLAGMSRTNMSLKIKIIVMINTFIINRFDSYVFLTEYMNELINKKHKPYVVVEGQVDINMANVINDPREKYDKRICMYTGALKGIYGIKLLTDAFLAAGIDDAALHFYGSGDFEREIREICKERANIEFFGTVANDIIVKEQIKATLLINPRPTNEEYTKYSFPSKNMEYMVSGTPILTTNLPGMPKEYQHYVYLIKDETVKGLTNCLRDVLSKSREELHQRGMAAREYVLRKKNNVVQTHKILEMIRNELGPSKNPSR